MMSSGQNSMESDDNAIDMDNSEKAPDEQTHSQPSQYFTRSRSSGDDLSNEASEAANRHLRNLQFRNPGRFMEDFDPERSGREMRKMNRRIYKDTTRRNLYDEEGHFLADGRDECDCLDEACPGCHFPCNKCGSQKCGGDCRCNRRWYYQEMEIEGTNQKFYFTAPMNG